MSNALDCLSLCLQTPGCLPALCWGDYGIGKTAQAVQLAEALGYDPGRWAGHDRDGDLEMFRVAERGEGAVGVVPLPAPDGALDYPLPRWAKRLLDSGRPGLIVLDEVSCCPPALQPAVMGLALDGVIGGTKLPDRVKRVAIANPADQAAGGWDLAPALANRFVHLDWPSPSASDWVDWLTGNVATARAVRLDPGAWEAEWPKAKALGAAFIRSHPPCLHEDPAKAVGRTPPAVATPRTWECALRLLAACRAAKREDLYPHLAQGSVGPAAALEGAGAWLVWLRDNDLPDPEALLRDPSLLEHDPRRPDRTFAALVAVAEAALADSNGKKLTSKERGRRWNQAFAVLARGQGLKLGKDILLLPARTLTTTKKAGGRMPEGVEIEPTTREVCRELKVFLDEYRVRETKPGT